MGFRFWRRIRIAPGLTVNLSKSLPSLSVGPRGAKLTVGPRGVRATVGAPGTGLFYTVSGSRSATPHERETGAPVDALDSAFFQGLVVPPAERTFVEGCREVAAGNDAAALASFRTAVHLADGAFMAGLLALGAHLLPDGEAFLNTAVRDGPNLGLVVSKYGILPRLDLGITHEVVAHLVPCVKSATLALVEIYQRQQRWHDASNALQYLYRLDPSDPVVRLSIAEIFIETKPNDPEGCRKVVQLAEGTENDSEVHAAMLLYKAMALRGLNMPAAALEVLSSALRRTKGRSEELLRALRYQRALVFVDQVEKERARTEFEKLYAEAPDYEDVASRLGVR